MWKEIETCQVEIVFSLGDKEVVITPTELAECGIPLTEDDEEMELSKVLVQVPPFGEEENASCPHCHKAILQTVAGDPPWSIEHWQCPKCDSTYCKEEE